MQHCWCTVHFRAAVTLSHIQAGCMCSLRAAVTLSHMPIVQLEGSCHTVTQPSQGRVLPAVILSHRPNVTAVTLSHSLSIHVAFGHLSHCHTSPLSGFSAAVTLSRSLPKVVLPACCPLSHRPNVQWFIWVQLSHCDTAYPSRLDGSSVTLSPGPILQLVGGCHNVTQWPAVKNIGSCHTVTQAQCAA
jgi:hypothetical protein